jgi:hypothetical protein
MAKNITITPAFTLNIGLPSPRGRGAVGVGHN